MIISRESISAGGGATFNGHEQLTQLIEEIKSRENYIIAVLNRAGSDSEHLKKEKAIVLPQYQDLGKLAVTLV